jgi:hypothetical protein
MEITFSSNLYDDDGDVYSEGIFLHFGECFILKVSDISELENLIEQLQQVKEELCEK